MTDTPTERESESMWIGLRRRKVVQWGLVYVAAAWGFLQGLEYVGEAFHWPEQLRQIALIALLIGLPVVLVLAWYHGDRGQQRVSTPEFAILTLLLLLGGGAFWYYQHVREASAVASTTAQAAEPAITPFEAAAVPNEKSIAVLPFVNMSSDPEQEYFSDGLSEELLNLLVKLPDLKVIARTSSFAYKGKDTKIADIARELRVAHVLEGSVRKAGDQVRITAQLIHAMDSTHLWSETYDRTLEDVFAVQDDIAGKVAQALEVTLLGGHPSASKPPKDLAAYNLFLQGRYLSQRAAREDLERAVKYLRQSLSSDPAYAPAWVELAAVQLLQADWGYAPAPEKYSGAKEAIAQALALDPESASAHALNAWVQSVDLDWAGAGVSLRRALELEPGNAEALLRAGWIAAEQGRSEEGLPLLRKSVELDPLRVFGHTLLASLLSSTGRKEEAIEAYLKLADLSADGGHVARGEAFELQDRIEDAITEYEQHPDEMERLHSLSRAYFSAGRNAESDAALEELKRKYGNSVPFYIAGVHAWRGEDDQAFRWLDRAYQQNDVTLFDFKLSSSLKLWASDPRYKEMLRKLNLPE